MNQTFRFSKLKLCIALSLCGALATSAYAQEDDEDKEDKTVLEEFIVSETESALNDTLLPTEREISGLFGDTTNVLQVPRSVTLLSPKIMDQFNIDDLSDLKKVASGTQTFNFYGSPFFHCCYQFYALNPSLSIILPLGQFWYGSCTSRISDKRF